jgi:F-type H+-transporting ATPase subunit b
VNINLTLIVQMLVFVTLIWITMKFVWPMILTPMNERERRITLGLAAAEKGQQELVQANDRAESIIRDARERAGHIIEQAQHRANDLIEQAKANANSEGQRLVAAAHQQIELDSARAREGLRREVAQIAVSAASKVLEREIDPRTHADLLSQLATQI